MSKRLSGCGSGTEYLAVTPWGDFYPCHQFVGQEEFLMGNVDEGITKTGDCGRIPWMQRIFQGKLQNLLCQILLQWWLYGEFLQVPQYDP